MRVGIGERDISTIISVLNSIEYIKLDELLIRLLTKRITSSDLLFLVLQRLEKDGYVSGQRGVIRLNKRVDEKEGEKIKKMLESKLKKSRKLFVTPLEVSKFYQCPRRLFLEKITLSKQVKERKGRVWDGEVVHLAVNLLVKRFMKGDVEESIEEVAKMALSKYEGKTELDKGKLIDFLSRLHGFLKGENLKSIFTEKTFESFRHGLIGTPDLVAIRQDFDVIPMDIKLGKLSRRGIKEEHLLQCVGESILVEDFFRKRVNLAYIIYFQSNSLARINITRSMKSKFLEYKRGIEKMCRIERIPMKSRLPNYRRRVCLGCHVKEACENIESLKRIGY